MSLNLLVVNAVRLRTFFLLISMIFAFHERELNQQESFHFIVMLSSDIFKVIMEFVKLHSELSPAVLEANAFHARVVEYLSNHRLFILK